MRQHHRNQQGFTLLEVLTVIIIIAMFATNVATYFKRARTNTNDSIRLSNIKAIIQALQIYHINNGHWPYPCVEGPTGYTCASFPSPTCEEFAWAPCYYASGSQAIRCESRNRCRCSATGETPLFDYWLDGHSLEGLDDYFITNATPSDPTEKGSFCPGTYDVSSLKRYYEYTAYVARNEFFFGYRLDSYHGANFELGRHIGPGASCAKSVDGCWYAFSGVSDGSLRIAF